MKNNPIYLTKAVSLALALALLITVLTGCGKQQDTASSTEPVTSAQADAADAETLPITGTWQTASMGYEYDGTTQPEYYVQFTDTEIVYGHMKDGEFISDHADPIVSMEAVSEAGWRVQAESSNGVQYTYQTSEGDDNVLEYYETWQEDAFPEQYSAGASLSKCD